MPMPGFRREMPLWTAVASFLAVKICLSQHFDQGVDMAASNHIPVVHTMLSLNDRSH